MTRGSKGRDGRREGTEWSEDMKQIQGPARLEEFWRRAQANRDEPYAQNWFTQLMPFITLVSSSLPTAATSETEKVAQPRAIFRYTVQKAHCNALHNLHGGATATLFDFLTTLALVLVNAPGFWWYVGVTRTLNVTYLRPAAEGETVLFESEVVHAGQRLCSLRGVMRRESDGLVLATCEHGKVNTDPPMERGSKL